MFDLKWTWTLLINYFWDETDVPSWVHSNRKHMVSWSVMTVQILFIYSLCICYQKWRNKRNEDSLVQCKISRTTSDKSLRVSTIISKSQIEMLVCSSVTNDPRCFTLQLYYCKILKRESKMSKTKDSLGHLSIFHQNRAKFYCTRICKLLLESLWKPYILKE